jgi:hypothetical protein
LAVCIAAAFAKVITVVGALYKPSVLYVACGLETGEAERAWRATASHGD